MEKREKRVNLGFQIKCFNFPQTDKISYSHFNRFLIEEISALRRARERGTMTTTIAQATSSSRSSRSSSSSEKPLFERKSLPRGRYFLNIRNSSSKRSKSNNDGRSNNSASVTKTVLVPIANGTEEMEAVIIIDVLRRAGVKVTVASIEEDLLLEMSRGVFIKADCFLIDCRGKEFDCVAIPGGMPGASRLGNDERVREILKNAVDGKKIVAAMCAAPAVVLNANGFLRDCDEATCHPAFDLGEKFEKFKQNRVCVSGAAGNTLVITSQGPGTAIEFALAITKELLGEEKRREIALPMCVSNDVLYS